MKKMLLVEDALELARVIIREFEKSGFEVFHASDGLTIATSSTPLSN